MSTKKINWGGTLLELVVVIIGITIAFWIENTAQKQASADEELMHLKGIADDLETDARLFGEFAGYVENTLNNVRRLNQLIREKDVGNDSLNFLILRAGWTSTYDPRDISYQSLRSSGSLDQIRNFDLRKSIVYHYEQKLSSVKFQNGINENHLDKYVTPIQLKFADFTSVQQISADFFKNREIKNVFAGLEGQLSNKVGNYKDAVDFTKALLTEVQVEIDKF